MHALATVFAIIGGAAIVVLAVIVGAILWMASGLKPGDVP